MYKKPPIENVNAFQIFATINRQAFMLAVGADKPWKTLAELTAAMKAKGEKATYATSTPTSVVVGAIYKEVAGLQAVDVNYRTSTDAYNDMLSGAVDFGILEPVSTAAAHRQGKLRILGVSTDQRLEAAPDLPTMIEGGIPGLSMNIWWAAMVPAKTPKAVTEQLSRWFNQVTASEDARKFLNTFASDPYILSAEEAQALINKEVKDWADYIRLAKIEPQG
jgi:tripartite-type tricarboxylate transporter receptor subunit TctC